MSEILQLSDSFELYNGVKIPCIGFGTWQIHEGEPAREAVRQALECGYRHIDTAAAYENEKSVGEAVKNAAIDRKDIFITSKVFNCDRGYENTLKAFERSLEKLKLHYLDLYLIHWPAAPHQNKNGWQQENLETWRALEELYEKNQVRAIGVCNFLPHHLKPLLQNARYRPMVNQIEFHPGYRQRETVDLCLFHHILTEAWSPLGSGKILADKRLAEIAGRYGKTPAQICIRWCLQQGILPLPKSRTKSRIAENAAVFDFVLTAADMDEIDGLTGMENSGLFPDQIDF